MYIVAFASLALWVIMIFSGLTFNGLAHLLLVVMVIAMLTATIKDNRELMP